MAIDTIEVAEAAARVRESTDLRRGPYALHEVSGRIECARGHVLTVDNARMDERGGIHCHQCAEDGFGVWRRLFGPIFPAGHAGGPTL